MVFDVYGRFQLEVARENGRWVAYRISPGLRALDASVTIPGELEPDEIAGFLDDLFHESCRPGEVIRVIP